MTIEDLKAIKGKKIKFNVPEPYNEAQLQFKYLNSDQHVFYQMRTEKYILDYTERSVNIFNKESKNHIRISNESLEAIVDEILK